MNSSDLNYNRQGTKPTATVGEEPIKMDGFGQVIQMLQVADQDFRDSLLKRLSARDPELARQIKAYLNQL
jgi:hypothetical protein